MSAVTQMLDFAAMAAVAWAHCFGLPLCASMSAAPVAGDTASRGVLPRYKILGIALRLRSASTGPTFEGLVQTGAVVPNQKKSHTSPY